MQTQYRRIGQIILVLLACAALAIAGGAPSDHHVSGPSSAGMAVHSL